MITCYNPWVPFAWWWVHPSKHFDYIEEARLMYIEKLSALRQCDDVTFEEIDEVCDYIMQLAMNG